MNSSQAEDGRRSTKDTVAPRTKSSLAGEESSASATPQTRVACDACRDRKIRCNRHRPVCGRCVKMGINCRYSSRSASTPSKLDLTRILATMNNRLQQAEAQLASSSTVPSPQPSVKPRDTTVTPSPIVNLPAYSTAPGNELYDLDMASQFMGPAETVDTCPEQGDFSFLDLQLDSFPSEMLVDQIDYNVSAPMLDGAPAIFSDPMYDNFLASATFQAVPKLSHRLLQRLHDICFDIHHPIMTMVDRGRFEAEMSQPSPSLQVQALSYAIGALGALSIDELHCHVERCYQQSRILIDLCERQESCDALSSIDTVQACTLLAYYELKQPNFGRAWMSLGRAIRLAKMMGLDQGNDSQVLFRRQRPSTEPLPQFHPAEIEERRRTFWAIYILDSFASTSTNSEVAFSDIVCVPLPGPEENIRDFVKTDVIMLSLPEVFGTNKSHKFGISSFAGVVIMVYLYRQCAVHIKSSSQHQSHNFWETHYGINKSIDVCRTDLLVDHIQGSSSDDPVSLALRMCLDTVEIMLHECALLKVQKDHLPDILAADAISKCTLAATDITDSLEMGQRLSERRLESFQQLNNFHAWPITTAIQLCCRLLTDGYDDVSSLIHVIRTLSTSVTTKFLVDQRLMDANLLEKAETLARSAE